MSNESNRIAGVFRHRITPEETRIRASNLRHNVLKNICASGARVAIIVVDSDRHLKLKFRTWIKLKPEQLTPDLKYNRHSKFVFVVRNYDELPTLTVFIGRVAIALDSVNRQLTLMRSQSAPTRQTFRSDELERVMNEHAKRPNHQRLNQVGSGILQFAQSLISTN